MALVHISDGTPWNPAQPINDARYPRNIEQRWSDAELAAIGLRRVDPVAQPRRDGVSRADVNVERERRLMRHTFAYDFGEPLGVQHADYSTLAKASIQNHYMLALAAVMAGVEPGDFHWHGEDEPFAWIMADNTRVPMDAQLCLAWSTAAISYPGQVMRAASRLKALEPIPEDYADDKHWP